MTRIKNVTKFLRYFLTLT